MFERTISKGTNTSRILPFLELYRTLITTNYKKRLTNIKRAAERILHEFGGHLEFCDDGVHVQSGHGAVCWRAVSGWALLLLGTDRAWVGPTLG